VSDARVRGIYKDIKDPQKEYQRKVRTAIRGMAGLARLSGVLNPSAHGLFAFQVVSHKLMRWRVPWFLLGLFVSSVALYEAGTSYRALVWAQRGGYVTVALAHLATSAREISLLRIAYYFVQANLALAHAGIMFVLGKRAEESRVGKQCR